ncbi:hypothetical protein TCAL_09301 [Tigriopus californicus]|uniref:39S ribosomal protein L28, mitochondrial n=1 Tax=Tigriopus californicus TaxID=6832 RepID=A0A553NZX4_TIGCA|nr:large ribosomal subunit protein bL28m-like [Tigriopus californicus]TRY70990.1 hypothetical protein TCAL_09301 [Tigriopus californicus]|eukprot:TCALIF_09301-PA protein Name:"Similar to MRPL28 39S ribosomal protein L28, mitochondrial (Bos taurus)" AED:0.01 eAED:0.02 QI:0/-1/0/1/-1/1/1/0/314
MACQAGQAFFKGRMNLRSHIERSVKDMRKYEIPVAGRNLYLHDEFNYGIDARLPAHYKTYYREWQRGPEKFRALAFQYKDGVFEKDEFGQVRRIQNHSGIILYPDEFHEGLWGGEGVIKGVQAPKPAKRWPNTGQTVPRYWFPKTHQAVVYSEVLDQALTVTATPYGEYLVDQYGSLDSYLLQEPVNEVYSRFLLRLKREILLALVRRDLYPHNERRKAKLLAKYEPYVLPDEEADWHGLSLKDARLKQGEMDRLAAQRAQVPQKIALRRELVDLLKGGDMDEVDADLILEPEGDSTLGTAFKSVSKNISKKFK